MVILIFQMDLSMHGFLIIGICGLCAHFCITKALALAPAVVVSPLEFLRLPFISIIGYFIYNEDLEAVVFWGLY